MCAAFFPTNGAMCCQQIDISLLLPACTYGQQVEGRRESRDGAGEAGVGVFQGYFKGIQAKKMEHAVCAVLPVRFCQWRGA
jgi:hypothetical protein